MVLTLNGLLRDCGVSPDVTAVILHTPRERKLRRNLPAILRDRRELFEAFQASHSRPAERTLQKRTWAVSFIGLGDGTLTLAGVYKIAGHKYRTTDEILADPSIRCLLENYDLNYAEGTRPGAEWFELRLTDHLEEFIGRLRIAPRLSRAYVRLAENLNAPIVALDRISVLDAPPPEWREVILTGPEVRTLNQRWKDTLRQWRGIYLIVDERDGARYVGAAYGEENLLGRWQDHVSLGVGVTQELAKRNPAQFRFSILQLLAPDAEARDVIRLEHNWMNRLHTHEFGLNA